MKIEPPVPDDVILVNLPNDPFVISSDEEDDGGATRETTNQTGCHAAALGTNVGSSMPGNIINASTFPDGMSPTMFSQFVEYCEQQGYPPPRNEQELFAQLQRQPAPQQPPPQQLFGAAPPQHLQFHGQQPQQPPQLLQHQFAGNLTQGPTYPSAPLTSATQVPGAMSSGVTNTNSGYPTSGSNLPNHGTVPPVQAVNPGQIDIVALQKLQSVLYMINHHQNGTPANQHTSAFTTQGVSSAGNVNVPGNMIHPNVLNPTPSALQFSQTQQNQVIHNGGMPPAQQYQHPYANMIPQVTNSHILDIKPETSDGQALVQQNLLSASQVDQALMSTQFASSSVTQSSISQDLPPPLLSRGSGINLQNVQPHTTAPSLVPSTVNILPTIKQSPPKQANDGHRLSSFTPQTAGNGVQFNEQPRHPTTHVHVAPDATTDNKSPLIASTPISHPLVPNQSTKPTATLVGDTQIRITGLASLAPSSVSTSSDIAGKRGKGKIHQCLVCPRSYRKKKTYRRHVDWHKAKYQCKKCFAYFAAKENLMMHVCGVTPSEHEPSERVHNVCAICSQCSYKAKQEISHKEDHSSQHEGNYKQFMCEACHTYYPSRAKMSNHVRQCHIGCESDVIKVLSGDATLKTYRDEAGHTNSRGRESRPSVDEIIELSSSDDDIGDVDEGVEVSAPVTNVTAFNTPLRQAVAREFAAARSVTGHQTSKELQCNLCQASFRSIIDLVDHKTNHPPPVSMGSSGARTAAVDAGGKVAPTRLKTYEKAQVVKSVETQRGLRYICEARRGIGSCNKVFQSKKALLAHVGKIHPETPLPVFDDELAQVAPPSEEQLRGDRRSPSSLQGMSKTTPGAVTATASNNKGKNSGRYICCKIFKSLEEYNYHQVRCKDGRPDGAMLECSKCKIQSSNYDVIQDHRKKCRSNSFRCIKCHMGFETREDLVDHESAVDHNHLSMSAASTSLHEICSTCGRCFSTANSLFMHQKSHLAITDKTGKEKQHKCESCQVYFAHAKSLVTHANEYHRPPGPTASIANNTDSSVSLTGIVLSSNAAAAEPEVALTSPESEPDVTSRKYSCADCHFYTNIEPKMIKHLLNRHSLGEDVAKAIIEKTGGHLQGMSIEQPTMTPANSVNSHTNANLIRNPHPSAGTPTLPSEVHQGHPASFGISQPHVAQNHRFMRPNTTSVGAYRYPNNIAAGDFNNTPGRASGYTNNVPIDTPRFPVSVAGNAPQNNLAPVPNIRVPEYPMMDYGKSDPVPARELPSWKSKETTLGSLSSPKKIKSIKRATRQLSGKWKCPYCGRHFLKYESFTLHKVTVHRGKLFISARCVKCSKNFTSKSALTNHQKSCNCNLFMCPVCKLGFPSREAVLDHEFIHKLNPDGSVDGGRVSIKYEKGFQQNLTGGLPVSSDDISIDVPPSLTHICEVCYACFAWKGAWSRHSRIHEEVDRKTNATKVYKCEQCTAYFATSGAFLVHCKKYHAQRNAPTILPRSTGVEVSSGKTPSKTYPTKRPKVKEHKCSHCKKIFSCSKHLVRHLKINICGANFKMVKCPTCDNKYTSAFALQAHSRICIPEKNNFYCDQCRKGFKYKEDVDTHFCIPELVDKTPPKGIVCNICKHWMYRIHLNMHGQAHEATVKSTGEPKKIQCSPCQLYFTASQGYHHHCKLFHRPQDADPNDDATAGPTPMDTSPPVNTSSPTHLLPALADMTNINHSSDMQDMSFSFAGLPSPETPEPVKFVVNAHNSLESMVDTILNASGETKDEKPDS